MLKKYTVLFCSENKNRNVCAQTWRGKLKKKKVKKRKNYIYQFLENECPEPLKVAHGTEGFRGKRFESHDFNILAPEFYI